LHFVFTQSQKANELIVTGESFTHIAAGFGVGVALAGAPGPVQAILVVESVRGGLVRGFRTMLGANVTFGLLLLGLAVGLSVAPPSGVVLRLLKVTGGAFLLWLAIDGLRTSDQRLDDRGARRRWTIPPVARGALAVLLNPGAWLFLGAVASPLLAAASRDGGSGAAVAVVVALVIGVMLGDGAVVLLGGMGIRKGGVRVEVWVRRALALVLSGLGIWLLLTGFVP
jgi:threonine/homoserine/homoserine lactone efflux protein